MWRLTALPVLGAALALGGCITKKEHERIMNEAAAHLAGVQEKAARDMQATQAAAKAQLTTLGAEIERLKGEITARERRIDELTVAIAGLERKVDDAQALNGQLSSELERAGKNVGALVAERGSLSKALEESKARLEELRKAQEAAQKRADLMRELLLKFKRMIDSGELKVVLRDGRMVLQLRNDVLFDSGRVNIKPEGLTALEEVARILSTFTDRKLQVAGHTDNIPIGTDRFPSNWELSTARGVAVVRYLIEKGVRADLISAAGYGETDPVAPNDTPESRAKNRRIEIVLQPNIAELVQVPELK